MSDSTRAALNVLVRFAALPFALLFLLLAAPFAVVIEALVMLFAVLNWLAGVEVDSRRDGGGDSWA